MEISKITVGENRRRVDPAKVAELRDSIKEIGLINPITVTEAGHLVAGMHRLEAVRGLGWTEIPSHIVALDGLRAELAEIDENLIRNELHFTEIGELAIRRDELLTALGERASVGSNQYSNGGEFSSPPKTTADIAKEIGVSERVLQYDKQIARDLTPAAKEAVRAADISKTDALRLARMEAGEQDAVASKLMSGEASNVVQASKAARREAKSERKAYIPPAALPDTCRLFPADIRGHVPVDDNSVDFIITDPPYPKEYISLYGYLSTLASRVLKPGGSLLAMCGQSYLPEVMAELQKDMTYHWCLSYLTPGQSPQLWVKRTNTFWKPVLWFVKGEYTGDHVADVIKSPASDKEYHEWGQSVGGFAEIIEKFTYPGQIIYDPFLGGGTTGVAAVKAAREFIGSDIEQDNVDRSRERIMEVLQNGC